MRRILGDLGRMIGRPLADMCTMLNPDAIIVDGTAGPAGESIVGGIKEAVARYAAPAVDVIAGELGAQADILGGIALARQELPAEHRRAQPSSRSSVSRRIATQFVVRTDSTWNWKLAYCADRVAMTRPSGCAAISTPSGTESGNIAKNVL